MTYFEGEAAGYQPGEFGLYRPYEVKTDFKPNATYVAAEAPTAQPVALVAPAPVMAKSSAPPVSLTNTTFGVPNWAWFIVACGAVFGTVCYFRPPYAYL